MTHVVTSADEVTGADLVYGAILDNIGEEKPVCIGPVIAGEEDGQPVYFVELLFLDGRVERRNFSRTDRKYDRTVKNEAYYERMELANMLRDEGVVVAHDLASFRGMRAVLARAAGRPMPKEGGGDQ